MPRSKNNMNWTGVTVSHGAGPTVITLSEITDVQVTRKGDVKRFSGDAAIYPKAIASKNRTRSITLVGGDVGKLATIPDGAVCTVVAILNDFLNGTGAGALTTTAANAILVESPFSGKHNEFASGTVTFECFSTDGTTDPITTVEAT